MEINILILSVGTRNKIVQYLKKALTDQEGNRLGSVIATDMSNIAPAIYEADKYYQVPRMMASDYMEVIFDICRKEKITAILSLIDPELSLLAKHEKEFAALSVKVIGSSYELCEMSLDKIQMYEWLTTHGYKTAISKVNDKETIELLFAHADNLMIQEFLDGQEIGADVYIDMLSGEVVSIFTKRKIVMRAGETDKAVSFKDEKLFCLINRFVKEAGYRGQIDIDIFEIGGDYYISEVNPRFGGGYPHAYECGCNHMDLIVNNLSGKTNLVNIGNYSEDIYMMKYNEVLIR